MSRHATVTPYNQAAVSKKKQVTSMFDGIAPYYDTLNRVLSLGIDILWRKKAIKILNKEKPSTILDIATGTADLAMEAARTIHPNKITGLDISANMLAIGDKKIKEARLDHIIQLEVGDSENLPYSDESYDAVMAAFGVRNFENLEKGLSEMFRVLKPGGTLLILEFSKPLIFPLKQLFNIYFKYVLPVIGKVKSKDERAYRYLYDSVQAFPDYDTFTGILTKTGFLEAKYTSLSAGICCIYTAKK